MKRLCIFAVVAVLVGHTLAACTTLKDVRNAKGQGMHRMYDTDFETVWNTVPLALAGVGLSRAGENKEQGYVLARGRFDFLSAGENVAVFVERVGEKQTKVEVVSKRVMATNVFATDWAPEVLDLLDRCCDERPYTQKG